MSFLPIESLNINYGKNRYATLGVMLFLNDPEKRKKFIQTHSSDAYLKEDINIMDKVTPNFLEELLHTPSIDTIQKEITKIYSHAYQAGLIVIYLYSLQLLGKSTSMNRALR